MWDFLDWEWLKGNAAWVAMSFVIRAGLKWLGKLSFSKKQELAFWVLIPAGLLLLSYGLTRPIPPRLVGSIDRVQISLDGIDTSAAEQAGLKTPLAGILIVATIKNDGGAPSMVECCTLEIVVPKLGTYRATPLSLPSEISPRDGKGNPIPKYYGSDMLSQKLLTRPVGNGEMVRGILGYASSGINPSVLTEPGTTYRLSFSDVGGRPGSTSYVWPLQPNESVGFMPGLRSGVE